MRSDRPSQRWGSPPWSSRTPCFLKREREWVRETKRGWWCTKMLEGEMSQLQRTLFIVIIVNRCFAVHFWIWLDKYILFAYQPKKKKYILFHFFAHLFPLYYSLPFCSPSNYVCFFSSFQIILCYFVSYHLGVFSS